MILKKSLIGRFSNSFDASYQVVSKLDSSYLTSKSIVKHKQSGQKMFAKCFKKTLETVQRVKREISVLSSLDHPNIVSLFEIHETKESVCLLLEYCPTGDLHTALQRKKRFSEQDIKSVLRQLCYFLESLHAAKISHNDLKLENILLSDENAVKVCDFEFSSLADSEEVFGGTDSYFDPETRGKTPDNLSDMWSVGVIAYCLYTNSFPFNKQDSGAETVDECRRNVDVLECSLEFKRFLLNSFAYREERHDALEALESAFLSEKPRVSKFGSKLVLRSSVKELNKLELAVLLFLSHRSAETGLVPLFRALDQGRKGLIDLTSTLKSSKGELTNNLTTNNKLSWTEFKSLYGCFEIEDSLLAECFGNFDFGSKGVISIDDLAFVIKPETAHDIQEIKKLYLTLGKGTKEEFLEAISRLKNT